MGKKVIPRTLSSSFASQGSGSENLTYLTITGTNVSGFIYDVTQSGVNYTHSGKKIYLHSTADIFNLSEIKIYLNGTMLKKGVNVVLASPSTFTLNETVDNGDEIIIIS